MPNITIKIDDEGLVREVKVLAAKRNTSVSRLVRDYLADLVGREDEYERARRRALKILRQGFHLGGHPLRRAEIYEGRG